MIKERLFPDYIFESSWEVCNKVGGIYTVLSSRAQTLQHLISDHIIFIGPDFGTDSPYFIEEPALLAEWVAATHDLNVRVGRWNIPGQPIAILVDFQPFYQEKDAIYTQMWEDYGVDSLHAYGDYDEASMFSYAAARVVESFYHYYLGDRQRVVYHGNEWMTCLGLLYIAKRLPQIGTIFTTHATSIGRSIAGNNKPLYQYLEAYNGRQMADELNMQSKHSIEIETAHHVDCFTTVSDITARECEQLLDKPVDKVLPNGFENDFVPKGAAFTRRRKAARERLMTIAQALTGQRADKDALIISTSGRYEFRNKGIDVFIEAMSRLARANRLQREVLAFIEVPGWVAGPREDVHERILGILGGKTYDTPLDNPRITHRLHNEWEDRVLGMMDRLGIHNRPEDRVKVIFIPCYLDGKDGIVSLPYYDVLMADDLTVYPSYYEPWGYTPLESVAFHVPTVTTDLAGFGLWANSVKGAWSETADGAKVIHRTDYNYDEAANAVADAVADYAALAAKDMKAARDHADRLSKKALWSKFIEHYKDAYDIALRRAEERVGS